VTPTVTRTEPTKSDGEVSRLEFEIISRSKYSPEKVHKTDRKPSRYKRHRNVRIQITSRAKKFMRDLRKKQSTGAVTAISQQQLGSGDKYRRPLGVAYYSHDDFPLRQMLFHDLDYHWLFELLVVFVTNGPRRTHSHSFLMARPPGRAKRREFRIGEESVPSQSSNSWRF
jgi:hypothetical protein